MNANTMNLQALANTARECAGRVNKMTLTAMTAHWNLCVDQSCLDETYKIVGVPGRKAHLARILNAYADDIEAVIAYAERTKDMTAEEQIAESNGIIRQAAFDALDLFAQWNEIDAAHTEALGLNAEHDAVKNGTQNRAFNAFWFESDIASLMKANVIWCQMHDEALRMNDDFNHAQSMKAMKENAVCCDCEVSRQNWEENYTATKQYNEFDESDVAEALEENRRFDWLRARAGIFHVSRPDVKDHIVGEAHDEALRIEAERGTATIEAHL